MWAHNFKCQLGGSPTCTERPGQQAGSGFSRSGQAAVQPRSKLCTCLDEKQPLMFCHQEPSCLKGCRVLFCLSSSPQPASALTDYWFIWCNGKDQKMCPYTSKALKNSFSMPATAPSDPPRVWPLTMGTCSSRAMGKVCTGREVSLKSAATEGRVHILKCNSSVAEVMYTVCT